MSYSKLTPSLYSTTQQEKQLLNHVFQIHDFACGCRDPPSHLTWLLINNCNPQDFNSTEKEKLKKWLGTTTGETDTMEEDTGFNAGDLEKLFAQEEEDEG